MKLFIKNVASGNKILCNCCNKQFILSWEMLNSDDELSDSDSDFDLNFKLREGVILTQLHL